MNDPLLPHDPALPDASHPHDAVEHALSKALENLSFRGVRPSLVDVQQRARRRQRRRAAAMAGACAVVVLGGAGVLATRHDSRPLSIGAGGASTIAVPATTIACAAAVPTTVPGTLPDFTTVSTTLQAATSTPPDTTAPGVPQGLSAQATTTTYPPNLVPTFVPVESTTTDLGGTETLPPFVGNPCSARTGNEWRCQGPLATTSDGWAYYQYCEPLYVNPPVTTVSPTTDPFTTYPTGEIGPGTGTGTASTLPAP
jgi:hypothetical protein